MYKNIFQYKLNAFEIPIKIFATICRNLKQSSHVHRLYNSYSSRKIILKATRTFKGV